MSRSPKLREGTYFPEWLLERRRRAEAALTSVVATCYLLGVSTRRLVERAGQSRGGHPLATVSLTDVQHAMRQSGCVVCRRS